MKPAILVLLAAALVIGYAVTRGPAPPTPNPHGTFSFAALGDAPYYPWEERQYRLVLRELDANDLSFVLHVGDIFWRPCSDQQYLKIFRGFQGLSHPVVYTPGDNEWADCWEPQSGSYKPLERLGRLRAIFYSKPPRTLTVTAQSPYVENMRWMQEGIVFATVHLTGNRNAAKPFPGRTAGDDRAVRERTNANEAWLRNTFAAARSMNARAVVVAFHAAIGVERQPGHPYRRPFEGFIRALEQEAARFGRPVLLVHGDDHHFRTDRPLRDLPNVTRLEVPGSPHVGWVRVFAPRSGTVEFTFQPHLIPRWKYW